MLELNPDRKLAGVLAPLFALRGAKDLGVGDTTALKELIAWAASHGHGVVQILPINETGSDNSPYNILSAMAIEPTTLTTTSDALPDLTTADFERIVARHDVDSLCRGNVDYAGVKALKRELLRAAYRSFRSRATPRDRLEAFAAFEHAHEGWLPGYTSFRALVSWHGESEVFSAWPEEHRSPATAWMDALSAADKRRMRDLMRFHAYVQWIAYDQWSDVRRFAGSLGVALMGDVPVGVSRFSADVWLEPELFDLTRSSGAPPEKVFKSDLFTEKWGQNWGFPLYNWNRMAADDYAWWRRRLRLHKAVFDLLRVDHALGFFRIYSFPWPPQDNARFTDLTPAEAAAITGGPLPGFMDFDDDTDEHREANRRRGERLFAMMIEEFGAHRLIAEDLGVVPPYVRPTLAQLEVPGFKIPQWERQWDRLISGRDYQRLSLATYATHDHPPLEVHWNELFAAAQSPDDHTRNAAIHSMWELMDFCGMPSMTLPQAFSPEIHEILLRGLFACNSWLAVHMITDLFGTSERFNVPGSAAETNWTRRLDAPVSRWDDTFGPALDRARRLLVETGRAPK